MKLTQVEYCHNCDQQVTFTFDDTTMKQVIYCPVCGHEHYRELDGGTIINIRADMSQRSIRFAKIPELTCSFVGEGSFPEDMVECEYEEKEIIGRTEDGKAIVAGGDSMVVTNRRWGRDSRQ